MAHRWDSMRLAILLDQFWKLLRLLSEGYAALMKSLRAAPSKRDMGQNFEVT